MIIFVTLSTSFFFINKMSVTTSKYLFKRFNQICFFIEVSAKKYSNKQKLLINKKIAFQYYCKGKPPPSCISSRKNNLVS